MIIDPWNLVSDLTSSLTAKDKICSLKMMPQNKTLYKHMYGTTFLDKTSAYFIDISTIAQADV